MNKKEFSLDSIVSQLSSVASNISAGDNQVILIPTSIIDESKDNFYEIVNIDELASSIELNGLASPIVVEPKNDRYTCISGHRRLSAYKLLSLSNPEEFSKIPAFIKTFSSNTERQIFLIETNSTARELTTTEKAKQSRLLFEYYSDLKTRGEALPGRVRDIVAKHMGTSAATVERLRTIDDSLITPLKKAVDEEKIPISVATEVARMDEDNQNKFAEKLDEHKEQLNTHELKGIIREIKNDSEFLIPAKIYQHKTQLTDVTTKLVQSKSIQELQTYMAQIEAICQSLKLEISKTGENIDD